MDSRRKHKLPIAGEWFTPTGLSFNSIEVRPETTWEHFAVSDSNGIVGQGEITHTQLDQRIAPIVARLANNLRGEKLTDDSDVIKLNNLTIEQIESDVALASAVSGLRCAIADSLARVLQLPLVDYLRELYGHEGKADRKVQLYSNINRALKPSFDGLSDRSPAGFAEMAQRAMEDGFTTAKCAPFDECNAPFNNAGVPREAEIGLDRIRAVKDVIGPDRTLLVDCHSRFDLQSALALEPELREAGVGWFEEPIDPITDADDFRIIRDKADMTMAGAEMGYGVGLFKKLMEEDVLDVVMPDVKFCGGPGEAYLIGRELEARWEGSVSMHCPSGPLSLLASAHATAAFGATIPLEHAVYEADWRHEVLEPFEIVKGGSLELPGGPGLGARVDPVAIAMRGKQWTE